MSKDKRIENQGMYQLILDLKPKRCDSDVYINQEIDVTNLVKYMDKCKKEGKEYTYFHAFITALAKTIYNRPRLNYYIRNRHVYEHKDLIISFVAKVAFNDKSEEMMVLVKIDKDDNIDKISKKIKNKLDQFRKSKESKIEKKGANNLIVKIGKLPNIIRVPLVAFLKLLDKWGMLPKSIVEDNLYYSTIIVSNLGSIKCGAIYHNITDFGTCSGLLTIGEIKDKEVIINGKKEIRKFCEFGINLDERIAEGYYFVKSVKLLESIIQDPKSLEEDVSTKIEVKETH